MSLNQPIGGDVIESNNQVMMSLNQPIGGDVIE